MLSAAIKKVLHKAKRARQLLWQSVVVLRQYQHIKQVQPARFRVSWKDRWLHLRDGTTTTSFDRHYVFHTAWAARVIAETQPSEHVDIASSLYFVSSVSAFVPTRFVDYRPAPLALSGLSCDGGDLLALPDADESVVSLSCMHVVEHIGLGRYGDPLNYDGDLAAIAELIRVLAPGGQLLFVVPLAETPRIQFNAHRIYAYEQVMEMFAALTLCEFALIEDDGASSGLIRDANSELLRGQRYACGCFHFRKPDK